jgi:autotransporter-associated beta strand protein
MKNCTHFPFFTHGFRSEMAKPTLRKNIFSTLLLLGAMLLSGGAWGQTWIGTGANAEWLNASNWSPNNVPSSSSIALFTTANPDGNTLGIDMNTAGGDQQVGAIEFANSRTAVMTIGNSSTTVNGVLTLNGTTVNSISNVILRNNSSRLLTLQNTPTGSGTQTMGVALGNSTTNVVNINSSGGITISSNISGTGRQLSLNSSGSGLLILSGVNTYSGGTLVAGGRLRVDAVTALPTTGDVSVQTSGRLTLASGTFGGVNQSLTLNPNQTALPSLDGATNAPSTWQGTVAINANTRIDANGNNGSIIFSGAVSGSGALVKNGAGFLVLSSASNSLSGATQIFRGKLTVNSGSSMGTGDLTMSEAGFSTALELKNAAQTINSLSSTFASSSGTLSHTITLTGTALTIDQSANTTYGAGAVSTLTSIIAGTGRIIKSGTGTLTLSSANTYTGGTTITNGTLTLGASEVLADAGALTLNGSGANLSVPGAFTETIGALTLTSGSIVGSLATLSPSSTTASDGIINMILGGTGTFTKNTSGTVILSTNNTFTGKTTINGGFIATSGESSFGANPGSFTANQITLNGGGIQAQADINFSSNRGITLGASGGTFNADGQTITLTNVVAGSGSLTQTGTGKVKPAGAHTYTGGTIINGGTFELGIAGALADAGAVTVSGGTFDSQTFNETIGALTLTSGTITGTTGIITPSSTTASEGTISAIIGGTGTFSKVNSGTVTLTGANTFTGLTTVSAGTLHLNRSGGTTIPTTNSVTVDGGTFQISSNQTLNTVTLSSDGTLVVDNGVTLTINGTFNHNGGTIILTGTGKIAYGSTGTLSYGNASLQTASSKEFPSTSGPVNLTFNNMNGVSLNALGFSPTISGALTFTQGSLILGATNLTIGSSGSISGASSTQYVVYTGTGKLTRNNIGSAALFPIGDGANYTPVTITNSGTSDNFTVAFSNGAPAGCLPVGSVNASWDISEATAGGSNCTISIDYGSITTGAGFTPEDAKIAHCIGSSMDYSNGTSAGTVVTGSGFTNFSPFGITAGTVLPIELRTFEGAVRENKTELTWATATERNNAYFSIERSKDGVEFQVIGKVNGAGNSTKTHNYRFTDATPEAGLNFYRLKQVDFDAQFSYSKVVSVIVGKTGNVSLSPVPAQDQLQVNLETAFSNDGAWQLLDYAGRLQQSGTIAAETYSFTIDVANLSQGAYILRLVDGQTVVTKQFQK